MHVRPLVPPHVASKEIFEVAMGDAEEEVRVDVRILETDEDLGLGTVPAEHFP